MLEWYEKSKVYIEHLWGANQGVLRLMCVERCNPAPDKTTLQQAGKGRKSMRLLQALGDEPPDDGGAQVGGANQAQGVPTLLAENP